MCFALVLALGFAPARAAVAEEAAVDAGAPGDLAQPIDLATPAAPPIPIAPPPLAPPAPLVSATPAPVALKASESPFYRKAWFWASVLAGAATVAGIIYGSVWLGTYQPRYTTVKF